MTHVEIYLESYSNCITLESVKYFADPDSPPIISRRVGQEILHSPNEPIFQWSSAVKALTILLLRTAAAPHETSELIGRATSPAASLDYAITKEPNWLVDMFGIDEHGKPNAKLLFRRSNSERKQPGPVRLWVDQTQLDPAKIKIFVNSEILDSNSLLEFADLIESDWYRASNISKRRRRPVPGEDLASQNGSYSRVEIDYSVDPSREAATFSLYTHFNNSTPYPITPRALAIDLKKTELIDGPSVSSEKLKCITLTSPSKWSSSKRYQVFFKDPIMPGNSADYRYRITVAGEISKDPVLTHRISVPTELLVIRITVGDGWRFLNVSVLKENASTTSVEGVPPPEIVKTGNGLEGINWTISNPEFGAEYKIYWHAAECHKSLAGFSKARTQAG